MTRRWFRLDVEWYSSDWIVPMHGLAQLAWVRLIGHVKQNGLLGRSKALTPAAAGLLWRIPAKHVATMLEGATGDGALAIEDGEWVLTKWVEYQETDSTASERMRRYREKQSVAHGKPSNGANNALVTPVTRNIAEQPRNPSRDSDLDLDLKKAPSGPKKARAPKVEVPIPDDWAPNDTHRRIAAEEGRDVNREAAVFRSHAESHGRKLLSWDAGFRTWLRKANDMGTGPPNGQRPPRVPSPSRDLRGVP